MQSPPRAGFFLNAVQGYRRYRQEIMAFWQQILWIVFGVVLIIFMWPHARAELERSRQAEKTDWAGALVPVALVVLFIVVLVMLLRS